MNGRGGAEGGEGEQGRGRTSETVKGGMNEGKERALTPQESK